MSVQIRSGASGDIQTVDPTSKAGRVTLYGTDGNPISTVSLGGNNYFGNSFLQNIIVSSNNSSIANLAASATFTGTSESSLGIGAIQVNLKSDRQCTIQVQQAQEIPGVNWDTVDSYIVLANTGDARTIQATGSSFRVLVTNDGGSTTTFLRLQSVMAPVIEALPRALTQLGNLKVALVETTINKFTYAGSINALTPPATPTDIVVLSGSSTRTIKLLTIELSTTQTTAGTNTFFILRRSTANTGGTTTAITETPNDPNNGAATASMVGYTANPTLGTLVANMRATKIFTPSVTVASAPYIWNFDQISTQGLTLRGTAQSIALNFNGAALPAGLSVNCSMVWTEEL